jgi:cobalt/nickel transport system permease protein
MSQRGRFASTLASLTRAMSGALVSEAVARRPGLLQSLDPRVRLAGLLTLVIAVILLHKIAVVVALFAIAVVLGLMSHVSLGMLAKRVWLTVLAFTGVIALPALFLTPGTVLFQNPVGIPSITLQGLIAATLLVTRVETAVTLTTLLVLTTPWMHILKALRAFHVPQEVVMMLAMTHRYIFLLAETANQMFESRTSRTVGVLDGTQRRRVIARSAGVMLSKSFELSNEVFLAMQSRGFRGDAKVLVDFRMRGRDYVALTSCLVAVVMAVWVGRP